MRDVRRYKLNPATPLPWPGGQHLHARALSQHRLHLADLQTADAMGRMATELSMALVEDVRPDELLGALAPQQLGDLYDAWLDGVQVWAQLEDPDALSEWLRRSVNDCPAVGSDGALASNTELVEYFGQPAMELTEAQLVWYFGLRAAYEEFYHERPDGRPPRQPTRMWLRKGEPLEDRRRWLMND